MSKYSANTMSEEQLQTQGPAIERLKAALFPQATERDFKAETTHHLEDGTIISAEYYKSKDYGRQLIHCRVEKADQLLLGFHLGQDGVENIGSGRVAFSFGDSALVKISEPGVGIGYPGEMSTLSIDLDDSKKYASLGEQLANWVTHITQEKKVTSIPFQIIATP